MARIFDPECFSLLFFFLVLKSEKLKLNNNLNVGVGLVWGFFNNTLKNYTCLIQAICDSGLKTAVTKCLKGYS